MNLKEALNYRNDCLICQEPMKLKLDYLTTFSIEITSDGLLIKNRDKRIGAKFGYDGTFEPFPKFLGKNYLQPFSLIKECPICNPKLSGKMNITTPSDIKNLHCAYGIDIIVERDNFVVWLRNETVKYHDGTQFYHLNSNHVSYSDFDFSIDARTELLHGKFDQSLEQLFKLRVPLIDTSIINNIDQLISKIKLYAVMS
jgi:hypothetical protein